MKTPLPESEQPQTETEYTLLGYLSQLYGGGNAPRLAKLLLRKVERQRIHALAQSQPAQPLTENDILLITYADTLIQDNIKPLQVLKKFAERFLQPHFSGIHILPFFPFSSDDGFAVVDYTAVRADLGNWRDINILGEKFDLMFDLVINHCSREHIWFTDFITGRLPGRDYFIALPADTDTRAVVRPRNTPLLNAVETYDGTRHVWATFSDDQIDLNFANPDVLCRFVEILFNYVDQGAKLIRLDAIAFLWKQVGSNCMSLLETHLVVKILRLLLEYSGANVRLLTETNVPHAENVSYFGQHDEAHMVYQFSLAPLLVMSYLFNDGRHLHSWAAALEPAPQGCAYLNFIASHDGIGLRPLEGLVPEPQIKKLIDITHDRGGFVSLRTGDDGKQTPYELNIALFSAFGGKAENIPAYVGAHQLLLGFQGVPALYLRALLGAQNDRNAVEETGRTRSVNRGHLKYQPLVEQLDTSDNVQSQIYKALTHSLRLRKQQPAFSPEARQTVLGDHPQSFALLRECREQQILVLASFSPSPQRINISALLGHPLQADIKDLITEASYNTTMPAELAPFQTIWFELKTFS